MSCVLHECPDGRLYDCLLAANWLLMLAAWLADGLTDWDGHWLPL